MDPDPDFNNKQQQAPHLFSLVQYLANCLGSPLAIGPHHVKELGSVRVLAQVGFFALSGSLVLLQQVAALSKECLTIGKLFWAVFVELFELGVPDPTSNRQQ